MDHPFKYFTRLWKWVGGESKEDYSNCQITEKNTVMNSNTILKDEWGKEEETKTPHCKLKAACI